MMATYPEPDSYRRIYARYYNGRSPAKLCVHLGDIANSNCLDLCSGDGITAKHLFGQGAANVLCVDESIAMANYVSLHYPKVEMLCSDVKTALLVLSQGNYRFNNIVCRQGINYWLNERSLLSVADILETDGVFVFNTLNQKPSIVPRTRSYMYDARSYTEIAYSVGDVIHTVVACEGFEPHQSEILWLSREYLREILTPYFTVLEKINGNSSVYVCTRK